MHEDTNNLINNINEIVLSRYSDIFKQLHPIYHQLLIYQYRQCKNHI